MFISQKILFYQCSEDHHLNLNKYIKNYSTKPSDKVDRVMNGQAADLWNEKPIKVAFLKQRQIVIFLQFVDNT